MLKIEFVILIVLFFLLPFEKSIAAEYLSEENKILLEKAGSGDTDAQFKIASAYDTGVGAPRDGSAAMNWYLMAAKGGIAEAQNSVGSGLQAKEKYQEALVWYTKAAEQNHLVAINNLAYLFDQGLGVKQDRQKGFELYLKSANLGWPEAMWNIANMYGGGNIGDRDLYSACIWSLRAKKFAEPGNERLNSALKGIVPYLEKTLKSKKFKKCENEAEAWAPQ
ncbi:MAG: TPR repeat protein [Paraglaciecola sp.]|jgi:TPR repeat protein